MRRMQLRSFRFAILLTFASSIFTSFVRAERWTQPTVEELRMTSQPEVPGAAAVYLYREEITDDKLHVFTIYRRLKVLTEKGKEYGNVELNYAKFEGGGGYTVGDVEGRTIHPDGTVVTFTGKPYDKLIQKTKGAVSMSKVFSLPDVEVGSIVEYRFSLRYDDHYYIPPQWYIQSALFTRKAHYLWRPTSLQLTSNDDRGQLTSTVAWTPILPKGAEVKQTRSPGNDAQLTLEVSVHDVPPAPDEELMLPLASVTYRVLFYYSPYQSGAEFWKSEGKHWSKLQDKFIGPGPGVVAAVQQLTSASDSEDVKLRKLYAAVMQMENTDFTHSHSAAEERSQGFKEARNTDDVLAHQRGSSDQLADVFVAMARAAGMKAYVMAVTNRDRHLFVPTYFNLGQLDDYLAIVTVGGKEHGFDPGSRYCPYGLMAWKHTMTGGLRQTESGTTLVHNQAGSYLSSRVQRTANLTMDEHGLVTGTIKMAYVGLAGLSWRQLALTGDVAAMEHGLLTQVEHLLPAGFEVKLLPVKKVQDYEEPLVAELTVSGSYGSSTGSRILLPGDVFEANAKPTFSQATREVAVAFDYPFAVQDAVRINFPGSFTIESLPKKSEYQFLKSILYAMRTESTPRSFTIRRELDLGEILYMPDAYAGLRSFYGQFETADQESVVLKLGGGPVEKAQVGK